MSGDVEILNETTMAEIPRGRDGREVLRVTFTRGRTPEGKDVAWHAIRVWYRDDRGELRPGKHGVTIRARELHSVVDALTKAVAGSAP